MSDARCGNWAIWEIRSVPTGIGWDQVTQYVCQGHLLNLLENQFWNLADTTSATIFRISERHLEDHRCDITSAQTTVWDEIRQWREAKWPQMWRLWGPKGMVAHLKEEVEELQQSIERGESMQSLLREVADIVILSRAICEWYHVTPEYVARLKFEELRHRRWHPPDANGVIRHVKEDGEPSACPPATNSPTDVPPAGK